MSDHTVTPNEVTAGNPLQPALLEDDIDASGPEAEDSEAASESEPDDDYRESPEVAPTNGLLPYDLRPSTYTKSVQGTWIDNDTSGNFDPKEERRKERARRLLLKQRHKQLKQARESRTLSESMLPYTDEQSPNEVAIQENQQNGMRKAVDPGVISNGISDTLQAATIRLIRTRFAHPMLLNCDSRQNGKQPCMICYQPSLAFLGMKERVVKVQVFADGRPLAEIKRQSSDPDPTRVCMRCTASRFAIKMCPRHDLQPISDRLPSDLDHKNALMAIVSGSAVDVTKHCTVCCNVASMHCVSPDCHHQELSSAGCGLKLCRTCCGKLRVHHEGDLSSMIAAVDRDQPIRLGYARADLEFFYPGGVLDRHAQWLRRQGH